MKRIAIQHRSERGRPWQTLVSFEADEGEHDPDFRSEFMEAIDAMPVELGYEFRIVEAHPKSYHFILTRRKDGLPAPMPEPWTAKTYDTREEAVLDAKVAAVKLGCTVTVTRVRSGGRMHDEVEVTDVSTMFLSTRRVDA